MKSACQYPKIRREVASSSTNDLENRGFLIRHSYIRGTRERGATLTSGVHMRSMEERARCTDCRKFVKEDGATFAGDLVCQRCSDRLNAAMWDRHEHSLSAAAPPGEGE